MTNASGSATIQSWFLWTTEMCVVLIILFAVSPCVSKSMAQENNSPTQEKSASELRLEYAELNVKLVETELKLAVQMNLELESSIPSSVTGTTREHILNMKRISEASLERLKSNVFIGKEQLTQAKGPSTGDPEKMRIRYAEEKIRLAKVNFDAANADRLRGIEVPELEIVRLDLKYKLAQIKLELLGSPEHLLTLVDSLQRQIDQLREDLMTQDQRLSAVEDR